MSAKDSLAQLEKEFFETGYAVAPRFFDDREISEMRDAFDRLHAQALKLGLTQTWRGSFFVLGRRGENVNVHRIVWCAGADERLERVGRHPRLLALAGRLLGSKEMDQLISQAHYKMPGDGVSFDWHQDVQHREKRPGDWVDVNGRGAYVQTLLCLDDMTAENGPLLVVPGSAKRGRVQSGAFNYGEGMRGQSPDSHVAVTARAGDLILLHPYTLHGSRPNESRHARRLFVNGYSAPGANHRLYPGLGSGRRLRATEETP